MNDSHFKMREEERERADSSPPHCATFSTAMPDPTGCGHPWPRYTSMTNKPGHGGSEEVQADGIRRFGLAINTQVPPYFESALVATFFPTRCLFKFPPKNRGIADKRLWETERMHYIKITVSVTGNCMTVTMHSHLINIHVSDQSIALQLV